MEKQTNEWMPLLILERKRYGKLNELFELTQQLAQALDREDQVSVGLLLRMRREPILALESLRNSEADMLGQLPACAAELIKGAPPPTPAEKPVAEQVAQNARLSQKLLLLDERVNKKIGGKKAYYTRGPK